MSIALKAKLLILMHEVDFTYDGAFTLCSCGWKVQRGSSVADDHATHLAEVLDDAFASKSRTVTGLEQLAALPPSTVIAAVRDDGSSGPEAVQVFRKPRRTDGLSVWIGIGSYSPLTDEALFDFLVAFGLAEQILVLWEP